MDTNVKTVLDTSVTTFSNDIFSNINDVIPIAFGVLITIGVIFLAIKAFIHLACFNPSSKITDNWRMSKMAEWNGGVTKKQVKNEIGLGFRPSGMSDSEWENELWIKKKHGVK